MKMKRTNLLVIYTALLLAVAGMAQAGAQSSRISVKGDISHVLPQFDGSERGTQKCGFQASSDDIIRPCLVHVPEDSTPEHPLPLLIALCPSDVDNEMNGLDIYLRYGLEDHLDGGSFILMCLKGRPETGWNGLAIQDALDALAVAKTCLPVDADRVYLFGAGSGGNGAFSLGLQYPHLFAAMAVAESIGPTDLAGNALNLPLYIVHGVWRGSDFIELRNFRKMVKLFSSYGCTVKHKEHPDITWREFLLDEWEPMFQWLLQHRRAAYPHRVSYSAGQLADRAEDRVFGAYWVRMNAGKDAYVISHIDVTVTGNSVNVTATNVSQYTLLLSRELLDLEAPITVRTNGEVSFSGQIERENIKDDKTALTIDMERPAFLWVFAGIVTFVVLIGLGMMCFRLLRIRAKAREVAKAPELTAGFRGIWLIAMKEFRVHLLTERFLWTTLFCLGMVLVSFWLMTRDYQAQLTNHSLSLQKKDDLYSGNLLWYDLEPNHGTGAAACMRPTPIIKRPNVMSIFVQGLERRVSRPAHYSLHQELVFDNIPYTNFLLDMYVKPDLMYIVQIAMSLLALLYVFQSICGERETGTLKLMLANAVPRDTVLLGKWIGGYLGLILPFLLAMCVGVIALILMPSISLSAEHWIRLAWLLLASLLYISVFFALGILISTLTKRTITSFLVVLFAWVIIVLVWPNIGTLLARELKPTESSQQLQVKRELTKRRMDDQIKRWWALPTYGNLHFEIWHDVREAAWKMDAEHRRQTQQLADHTRILTRVSPAAAYAYAMMDIAGTNIGDELAYYDQLRRFVRNQPKEAEEFVYYMLYNHQSWDFRYMPAPWRDGLSHALTDLLLLVLVNVVLFLCAYLAFIRCEVR